MAHENSSLDRSNLANARTAGLMDDLNMTTAQYNQVLTLYYVPFLLAGPIGSTVCKLVTARYGIAAMVFGFGAASICSAAVKDFGSLMACRIFVGVFEGGFLPRFV